MRSKAEQENIAAGLSGKLAVAIEKSNHIMAEDIIREAGYMLPQSENAKKFLKSLLDQDHPEGFPRENVKKLIDLFSDVDLDMELWAIINKYDGFVSCMPEVNYADRMESINSKIVSSGLFSKPEIIHSYLEKNYTADDYFNWMLTSGFAKQPDKEKQACREELIKLANKYNGIKRRYTCELYLTQKI